MILVLLIVAWAIVLGPKLVRGRSARGGGSLDDFRARLSVIHQARVPQLQGLGISASRRSSITKQRGQKRRRDIFTGLLALCVATLAIGFLPSFRSILYVHVMFDVLLAAYVGLLIRRKQSASFDRYDRPVLAFQPIDD